ncbi:MAG TPA: hypothetical protein VM686_24355 [Polyangiaceae bacterium]|nr:hypothetical protein [Polyangiaceae bacterium]
MGVSGGALGVAAVSAIAWLTPHARALGLFVALLSPLPLAVMMFCGALALGAATQLGLAQAGAALGFALGLLAVAAAALELYLTRERPALSARVGAPVVALLCAGLALVRAELQLPHDEVRAYGGDVLAFAGGERQRLALVSHRSHFELYVDRTLKLSSVDAHRYAEALVHPALAVAASRRRILLLGGGTGVIEREILRWSGVETLTVVVTDRTLVELARRSPWLASASTAALADRRVRIVEAEPIVWLASNQARFDAVVADVEDPVGYRQSKHFTRHALGLVAAALADGGVASLQAPSPLTFPHAFASIRTTLLATGLTFAPYHAALPAIGDGGFFLFAAADTRSLLDRATEGAQHLPAGLRYVTPRALPSFFHFAADLGPALADGVPPNTLHTQPLVELYGDDHERQPER